MPTLAGPQWQARSAISSRSVRDHSWCCGRNRSEPTSEATRSRWRWRSASV